MARKPKIDKVPEQARVIGDPDELQPIKQPETDAFDPLVKWVEAKVQAWQTHRDSNYDAKWGEYERLWRGIWSGSEKIRASERSKFVSPALSEAVENNVSEIEEAVFGRGDFFDFRPNADDVGEAIAALDRNKQSLKEDLERSDFVVNVCGALLNSAVYGTGIGELVLEETTYKEIVPQDAGDGTFEAAVQETPATYVCLRSVNPRNFVIDPNASRIEDAMGVAVKEPVGIHLIRAGIKDGVYRKVKVEAGASDPKLKADYQEEADYTEDSVEVIRYYGLVPRNLLEAEEPREELFPDDPTPAEEKADESDMVESIVVIAGGKCLKAEKTPYLMGDRPVVAFPWDIVPGRFWGRGVCEKGNVPQKLLDAELRSRIDALAYSSAPMMAMDASRMPRGFKFEVAPGRSIPVSGDPGTVLKPFTFGQLDQNTWNQSAQLDQMVQRATGALDGISLAQKGVGGDARSGAVSMAMSGVAKRSKRTLMAFTDRFFIPALKKMLWRYMQFAPERYVPRNSSFVATSTTGIMQREYETQQLAQLLSTMQPGSREHKMILMGVVSNTGMANRQAIVEMLQASIQQDEQAQQMQLAMAQQAQPADGSPEAAMLQQIAPQLTVAKAQLELRKLQAEIARLESQTMVDRAKARQLMLQPEIDARSIAMKGIYNTPEEQMQAEFDRRMKIGDQMLEKADIESNERIAGLQAAASVERERIKAQATTRAASAAATPESVTVVQPVVQPVAAPFGVM